MVGIVPINTPFSSSQSYKTINIPYRKSKPQEDKVDNIQLSPEGEVNSGG